MPERDACIGAIAAEDIARVAGDEASVRGLAFHIAGHELRHLRSIQTLYWPRLNRVTAPAR